MSWYIPSRIPNNKIGGRNALKHRITRELVLAGKYGYIWMHGSGIYKALITSSRVAKQRLPYSKWPIDKTDETLISFGIEDLNKWCKWLKVPGKRNAMMLYINLK